MAVRYWVRAFLLSHAACCRAVRTTSSGTLASLAIRVVPCLEQQSLLGQSPRSQVRHHLGHLDERPQLAGAELVVRAAPDHPPVLLLVVDQHVDLLGPRVVR